MSEESSDGAKSVLKNSDNRRSLRKQDFKNRLKRKGSFLKISLTEKELEYRNKQKAGNPLTNFPQLISCTRCGVSFENDVLEGKQIYSHPLLRVLICEACYQFFGDGEFSLDEDGEDKYCRWCGEGGNLFLCSKCICGFCPQCIKKHFGKKKTNEIRKDDDWECYICNPEPLWKLRHICELAMELSASNNINHSRSSPKLSEKSNRLSPLSNKNKEPTNPKKDDYNCNFKNESNVRRSSRFSRAGKYSLRNSAKGSTSSSSMRSSCDIDEPVIKKRKIARYGSKGEINCFQGDLRNDRKFVKGDRNSYITTSSSDSNDEFEENDVFEWQKLGENQTMKFRKNKNAEKLREILKVAEVTSELSYQFCKKDIRKLERKNMSVSDEKLLSYCEQLKSMIILMSSSLSTVHNMIISFQRRFHHKGSDHIFRGVDNASLFEEIARILREKRVKTSHLITLVNDILNKYPYVALGAKGIDDSFTDNENNSVHCHFSPNEKDTIISGVNFDEVQMNKNLASGNMINNASSSEIIDSLHSNVMSSNNVAPDEKEKPICDSEPSTDIFEPDNFPVTNDKLTSNSVIQKLDPVVNSVTSEQNNEELEKYSSDFEVDMNTVYENSLKLKKQLLEDSSDEGSFNETSDPSRSSNNTVRRQSVTRKNSKRMRRYERKEMTQEEKEIARLTNLNSLKRRGKLKVSDSEMKSKEMSRSCQWREIVEKNETGDDESSSDSIALKSESDNRPREVVTLPKGEDGDDFLNRCSSLIKDYILKSTSSEAEVDEQRDKIRSTSKRKQRRISSCGKSNLESKRRRNFCSESVSSSDKESVDSFQPMKRRKKRIWMVISSDSDSGSVKSVKSVSESPMKGRKTIRKILKKGNLQLETRQAIKVENERKKRIAQRKECYEKFFSKMDESDKLVLDFNLETGEKLVEVPKSISKHLKPHQREGVRFMWDNCFESLEKLEVDSGSGCILAHCMGLGKTLQVIALVATLIKNDLGVNTILILCPLNVANNWIDEFDHWLKEDDFDINIYTFVRSNMCKEDKYSTLKVWHQKGGIFVLNYDMMRNLTNAENKMNYKVESGEDFCEFLLDPGPDLVICDEGHVIKNEDTSLSKCMKKIKTARRIVLTGTPFQNNLLEYHSMVQFIKPNFLGTKKEFMNRFGNPIRNGQFEDSTELDVKLMRARSHVLHKLLDGCIQRFDYSVLTPFLPEKHEYVISIRLTKTQSLLYQYYVEKCKEVIGHYKRSQLFSDFHWLQKIWTHPKLVLSFMEESNKESRDEGNESTSEESVICIAQDEFDESYWKQVIKPEEYEDIHSSGKLLVLFDILTHCRKVGDKVLVFSHSLNNLNLIEDFLRKVNKAKISNGKEDGCEGIPSAYLDNWVEGEDYFRMDGSTTGKTRSKFCKWFNSKKSDRARLFLISTKAGGVGINLVGANRVVVFDSSWNPSHDVQSIFRVYRFGQTKPCFIYRLVAEATMEEKIYERQVTKLSVERRVLDEHQIGRHYTMGDLQSLYKYDPLPRDKWKVPMVPKDLLLAEILKVRKDVIVAYHEHDSLLENKEDEGMTEEERKAAWEDFEKERFMNESLQRRTFGFPGRGKSMEELTREFFQLAGMSHVSESSIHHANKQHVEHAPERSTPLKIVNVHSLNLKSFQEFPRNNSSYRNNFPQSSSNNGL